MASPRPHAWRIIVAEGLFDWNKFCGEHFPEEVFNGALWTPTAAFEQGFTGEAHRDSLDREPRKWKMFNLVITSDMGLEDGIANLGDKIPHFDKLAILAVDPASIKK